MARFGLLLASALLVGIHAGCAADHPSGPAGADTAEDVGFAEDVGLADAAGDPPLGTILIDGATDGSPEVERTDTSAPSPSGVGLTAGGGFRQSNGYALWVSVGPPAPVGLRESTNYRVVLGPPLPRP